MALSDLSSASSQSSPFRRAVFIALMFLVAMFSFADRAVLAVLAQPVKEELGLSDFEVGILQGPAFAVVYALFGIGLGVLAERKSRSAIIAAATAFWSIATIWCGAAGSFVQLALGRVGVGAGEAAFLPAVNSMISDQFPASRRASMVALVQLGTPAGMLVGAIVAGAVAAEYGWRAGFYALGIPGVLLALVIALTVKEPARGQMDAVRASGPAPDLRTTFAAMATKKSLIYVILGAGLVGFGMGALSQFLAVFMARVYDMTIAGAAAYYGLVGGIATAIGLVLGSFGTDWLSKRDLRWSAWGSAIGLFLAPPIYFFALNAPTANVSAGLMLVAGSMLMVFYGPTTAMILNLLEPRMRATGIAVFVTLYTLVGSLGPLFVGYASDRFAERSFGSDAFLATCAGTGDALAATVREACRDASADGVRQAMVLAMTIFLVAGVFYMLAARSFARDVADAGAVRGAHSQA